MWTLKNWFLNSILQNTLVSKDWKLRMEITSLTCWWAPRRLCINKRMCIKCVLRMREWLPSSRAVRVWLPTNYWTTGPPLRRYPHHLDERECLPLWGTLERKSWWRWLTTWMDFPRWPPGRRWKTWSSITVSSVQSSVAYRPHWGPSSPTLSTRFDVVAQTN